MSNIVKRSHPIAGILSTFLPGLGQLIKKQYSAAVTFGAAYVAMWWFLFPLIGKITAIGGALTWVVGIGVHVLAGVHAWVTEKKR